MRVNKVYTRTGDDGETGLGGGQRVPKDAARIVAYGSVDELNSCLGVCLAHGLTDETAPTLRRIQNELFFAGSDLCLLEEDKKKFKPPCVEKRHVTTLETDIDRFNAELPPLQEFLLPGGSLAAASLHVARTVCRRAERDVVRLGRTESVGPFVAVYLNRLSDLLFVVARFENRTRNIPEPQWDKNG
jgi:cob(I)alamin adenosyltransferase